MACTLGLGAPKDNKGLRGFKPLRQRHFPLPSQGLWGFALLGAATVSAQADAGDSRAMAPRWSSAALGIRTLEDLPDALRRPFDSPFRATVLIEGERRDVTIDSCKAWQTWQGLITGAKPAPDFAALRGQGAVCDALDILKRARAARQSALPSDLMRLADTRLYPATLWVGQSDEALAQLARPGTSLASASGVARWQVRPQDLQLNDGDAHVRLVWLARGDFNGDGWEDALYRWQAWMQGASWSNTRLVMLTRRRAAGPMTAFALPSATDPASPDCALAQAASPPLSAWRDTVKAGRVYRQLARGHAARCQHLANDDGRLSASFQFADGTLLQWVHDPRIDWQLLTLDLPQVPLATALALLREAEQDGFGPQGCGMAWTSAADQPVATVPGRIQPSGLIEQHWEGTACNCKARLQRDAQGRVHHLRFSSAC